VLVYRIFAYDPVASVGQHGHPEYLYKPQGKGRLDNPQHYDSWYVALTPEAAVGEVFGDITVWGQDMFELPAFAGSRRALGVFELPDEISLLDLDDAPALLDRGLRPTQVIARNRAARKAGHGQSSPSETTWRRPMVGRALVLLPPPALDRRRNLAAAHRTATAPRRSGRIAGHESCSCHRCGSRAQQDVFLRSCEP
jgi:hypothetical protein